MKKLKLSIMSLFILISGNAFSISQQTIDTLGSSPKGQFVAIEEYGYRPDNNKYYVTVKILNIWKNQYVGKSIHREVPAQKQKSMMDLRNQVKLEAMSVLKSYNIVSG